MIHCKHQYRANSCLHSSPDPLLAYNARTCGSGFARLSLSLAMATMDIPVMSTVSSVIHLRFQTTSVELGHVPTKEEINVTLFKYIKMYLYWKLWLNHRLGLYNHSESAFIDNWLVNHINISIPFLILNLYTQIQVGINSHMCLYLQAKLQSINFEHTQDQLSLS